MASVMHYRTAPIPAGNRGDYAACGARTAPPEATQVLAAVTCARCRRSLTYRVALRPGTTNIPTVEEALAYTGREA